MSLSLVFVESRSILEGALDQGKTPLNRTKRPEKKHYSDDPPKPPDKPSTYDSPQKEGRINK